MSSFKDKVIAISMPTKQHNTGGASGIGLALAKLLASKDATLCIADISEPNLKKAATAISEHAPGKSDITTTLCDVRDPKDVDAWIEHIMQEHGRLDGAANLAGILGKVNKTHEFVQADWDAVIGVNLTGVLNSMRAELSVMKPGSSIVNAGSAAGHHGAAGAAAYCASKHGVHGLTKVAAKEYGPVGIRINAVAPGYIWTPMQEDVVASIGKGVIDAAVEAMPIPRFGTPEEVARMIAVLLDGEVSGFVTGSIVSVDGGWHT